MKHRPATFEVIHNIPSPYRVHLFNVLGRELTRRGWRLQVHYLASGHADRKHWTKTEAVAHFTATYWRDIGPTISRKEWHLNPGLIAHLSMNAPKALMVGGPWDTLSGAAVSILNRAQQSVAWFEGNTATPGNLGDTAKWVKRSLLERFDRWAVPGSEGVRLASLICGAQAERRCIMLPNIVDETRFSGRRSDRAGVLAQLGVSEGLRLAVVPARLISAKGLVPFLMAVRSSVLNGWAIRIMGDGPLRVDIEDTICRQGLGAHVSIVDPVAYGDMPALYSAADLFVLPSIHDPNPLSVVEAMHSGLPLLISRRVGNRPEALREEVNGWSFDPTDTSSVEEAVARAFTASSADLRRAGEHSRVIAKDFWESAPAVERFVNGLQLQE